jgi:glucosyl-dolichyl phosphate glucuronosyltransferase
LLCRRFREAEGLRVPGGRSSHDSSASQSAPSKEHPLSAQHPVGRLPHHFQREGELTIQDPANEPLISVVICTHNRSHLLPHAIQSVCQQAVEGSLYEVVVVDNNCTDNTRTVVQDFCDRHPNIRCLQEPLQGLSHARNCGWKNAKGNYVIYLDDDGKACEDWLTVAKHIIMNIAPAVFGGPYYACYNTPKPDWFQDNYESHTLGNRPRFLDEGFLTGNNIAFRRSILADLGGFDSTLGMSGKKIAYAEETDLMIRIRKTMPDESIYYDPSFYIYHSVAPWKMTMTGALRLFFNSGIYSSIVFNGNNIFFTSPQLFGKMTAKLGTFLKHCLFALVRRDRKKYPYFENYLYECAFPHVQELGVLFEQITRANRLVTEIPPPAAVDLKQPGLWSRGIYEDGWMGKTAEVRLSGGEPLNILRVAGLQPGTGKKALAILVDGTLLAERKLDRGAFEIEALVENAGPHWVKLVADSTMSLPEPDGRVVSILLKGIAFTPPPTVTAPPDDV